MGPGARVQPEAQLPTHLVPVPGAPSESCGEELAKLWAMDAMLQHRRQAAGAGGRGRARTPNPREVSAEERQLGVLPANASTVTGECWHNSHRPAGCLALGAWVRRNIKKNDTVAFRKLHKSSPSWSAIHCALHTWQTVS